MIEYDSADLAAIRTELAQIAAAVSYHPEYAADLQYFTSAWANVGRHVPALLATIAAAEARPRRVTEFDAPCTARHSDPPEMRCIYPEGHGTHFDGHADLWLSAAEAKLRCWEYFASLAFAYYDAPSGTSDVNHAWHELAGAIEHYRATGGVAPRDPDMLAPAVTA